MSSRTHSDQGNIVKFLGELKNVPSRTYQRLTGVVCTIGPASRSVEVIEKMLHKGMNIARLNFSHGTHEYHAESIKNLRQAVENCKKAGKTYSLAIALDTKGSEIRTGVLEGGGSAEVLLEKGQTVRVVTDPAFAQKCTKDVVYVDYTNIAKVVKAGDKLFVDDGLITLACKRSDAQGLVCEVEIGGMLGSSKGVNLPGVVKDLPTVSERDKRDLKFGVQQDVDMVFASFTRNAEEVRDIRKALEGSPVRVIAKIENQQGMDHMDEIIKEADGILVDRGDLGMEISPEKVPAAQKKIIAKCNEAGKPVVIATHLLESMVENPRPTRAESLDVANTVMDGADCLMLAGETAKGKFVIECITTMANICMEAEVAMWQQRIYAKLIEKSPLPLDVNDTVALAAVEASINSDASAIIVAKKCGRSAALVAKYRPRCPIVAVTRNARVARQLQVYRAVLPVYFEGRDPDIWMNDVNARVQAGIDHGKAQGFIKPKDLVVLVTGWHDKVGFINTMSVITVE